MNDHNFETVVEIEACGGESCKGAIVLNSEVGEELADQISIVFSEENVTARVEKNHAY